MRPYDLIRESHELEEEWTPALKDRPAVLDMFLIATEMLRRVSVRMTTEEAKKAKPVRGPW